MALGSLAWLLGVSCQLQQAELGPLARVAWALCAAGSGLLLAIVAGRRRGRLLHGAALFGAASALALAGWAVTEWRAQGLLAQGLGPGLEGRDVQVTGLVAQLPHSSLSGTRFVFDVESAVGPGGPVTLPPQLSLNWNHGQDGEAFLLGPAELRAGQRWRFTVRLRAPHGSANPGGFDAELWLFEQGLRAGGSVRSKPADPARLLDPAAGHPVERLRQHLRERIDARVADAAAAGVLAALAVGDQGAIDRADWDVFRVTGVAHLMSISGLHITMFAWLGGGLVGWCWRRSSRLLRWRPAPLAAHWGGVALACGYSVLAGWGVPAQRTVLMIAAVALLRTLGLRWPQPLVLLATAVLVTLLDPWALLQPGFWLSFVAVALLIASDPVQRQAPPAAAGAGVGARLRALLRDGLRSQAIATLGLAPLSLVFFQQLSVVGFVANLVAIPVVTLLVTPLALLGAVLPALWTLDAWLVQALLAGLRALAAWPMAQWSVAAAPAWAAWLGVAGGALLVMPLPWRLRALGPLLMLPLLMPPQDRPPPGRFELVAADVGQGTAVLLRTATRLLVYDTGPQYSTESDAGQRVLVPLLRHRGEARVDELLLSHRDTDHVGGAASLLAQVPVLQLRHTLGVGALATQVPQLPCRAGQRWRWDEVDFEVLHPDDATAEAGGRPNSVSCVLRVQGASGSVLLTGDIEWPQEAALLARDPERLRADVLFVPHHGSRTSSSEAFIDAVAPRVAVVQAGYRSRYGHPAPDVVERYTARGVTVVRTDRCGAWHWQADGAQVCERERRARYWHHRAGDEVAAP